MARSPRQIAQRGFERLVDFAGAAIPIWTKMAIAAHHLGIRGSSELAFVNVGSLKLAIRTRERADWRVLEDIFAAREYDDDYTNSVVIDCGGHVGIFSAYAMCKGVDTVLAAEPEPRNARIFRLNSMLMNIALGRAPIIQEAAVSSAEGPAFLEISRTTWEHALASSPEAATDTAIRVECVTLESLVNTAISKAAGRRLICKMDIEGAEYDVLLTAPRSTLEAIDVLWVETHASPHHTPEDLVKHLDSCGFKLERNQKPGVWRYARVR